jgi:tetratricopeptide (TPR) repeat protein
LRRRRSIGVEVARHRDLAGQPGQAYLDYLAACLRAERARHFHDVITWTRRAQALEETALTEWEGPEGLQAVRTVAAIRGRALLATGRTEEACHQLERSLDPAWGPAPEEEIARTRALLGEGWARMGRADRAIEHLKEALRVLPEGAPECPSAIGRLTQLRLLKGELHAAIETVEPAVNRARDRDLGGRAEASLNRRLASARAVEGRLVDARLLLEASDFALRRSPHEHLEERAILLCDLGDLDLLAGRYARAISHAEQALELCSEVREVNRVCAAYAILSVAYWRIGQGPKAAEAAERMALYLQGEGAAVWRPRLHTARVLLGLGRTEQAKRLLSTHQPPPDDQSFGTRAWWRALGARCVVDDDPTQAESAAQLALDSLPIGAASALDLLLDVSEAFLAVGKPEVCVPVLQGRLEAFRSENATGLLLEATVMLHRLDAPSLDRSPCATWVEEIRRHLHGPTSPAFLRRPDLIEVLEPSRLEG